MKIFMGIVAAILILLISFVNTFHLQINGG
jgi:hypothetical protein